MSACRFCSQLDLNEFLFVFASELSTHENGKLTVNNYREAKSRWPNKVSVIRSFWGYEVGVCTVPASWSDEFAGIDCDPTIL